MDFKKILGKFGKGAFTGALSAFGALQITGNLTGRTALIAAGWSILSAGIHGGVEAVNQTQA